ncbi:MAG: S24/S26 family peptidase [Clostridia bacterium]|nr:S24/S26 family peptidase [Clostridia bacterium]MBQ3505346.1 S24/S26 family peptidase [Clostridia bacterium]
MTSYEKYVFILCLIVFTLLTLVFSCMLATVTKQGLRLIRAGAEDKRIYTEYLRSVRRGKKKTGWLKRIITVFFALLLIAVFSVTIYMQITENKQTTEIPALRVVQSESMSDKYEKNTYLFENDLNDQFSRFDVVVTYQLPKEEDLKLYDIVVYEVDDVLLIHRIVGIEEPNKNHPDERWFVLQGDLVERADKFPVRYEQMKAIYRGERIPYVGSFILFLQSPAGYLCLILIVVEMIASPLMTKKLDKAEKERLEVIKEAIYKSR